MKHLTHVNLSNPGRNMRQQRILCQLLMSGIQVSMKRAYTSQRGSNHRKQM